MTIADFLESINGLNVPLLARLVWLPRHIYLLLEFSRITCFFNPLIVVVRRTDSQASNALHKLSQLTLKSRSSVYTRPACMRKQFDRRVNYEVLCRSAMETCRVELVYAVNMDLLTLTYTLPSSRRH